MVARSLVLVLLSVLFSTFACSGDDRPESSGPIEDTVEDPAAWESWTLGRLVYEAVTVEGGGSVRGTVRLADSAQPLADIPVSKDQAVCGEHRPDPSLKLGRENAVANVVVSLVGVTKGKRMEALPEPAKLDQVECVYVPHVQVVPLGTTLDIINSDPVLHNVHAYLNDTETLFNLALPIQGYRIQRTLDVPGIVSLRCDAGHTWMSGYIVVQEHPYYSLTTAAGSYSIDDVPAGRYRLKLWHGLLGETEVTVEVEANATAIVDLELNAPVIDPS